MIIWVLVVFNKERTELNRPWLPVRKQLVITRFGMGGSHRLPGSLLKLTRDKRGCWVLQQALECSEGVAESLGRRSDPLLANLVTETTTKVHSFG